MIVSSLRLRQDPVDLLARLVQDLLRARHLIGRPGARDLHGRRPELKRRPLQLVEGIFAAVFPRLAPVLSSSQLLASGVGDLEYSPAVLAFALDQAGVLEHLQRRVHGARARTPASAAPLFQRADDVIAVHRLLAQHLEHAGPDVATARAWPTAPARSEAAARHHPANVRRRSPLAEAVIVVVVSVSLATHLSPPIVTCCIRSRYIAILRAVKGSPPREKRKCLRTRPLEPMMGPRVYGGSMGDSPDVGPATGHEGTTSLQLLLDSFVAITSELNAAAILERAVDLARLLTSARYGAAVALDNGEIAEFVHAGLTNAQFNAMPHLPLGKGMLGAVLQQKTPIRLDV